MRDGLEVRPLRPMDYACVSALWREEPGVALRGFEDSEAGFGLMVRYNPNLCLGLWRDEVLLGAVLAGFDGRRAYVYHFVIAPAARRQGLGRRLAKALRKALVNLKISRVHLFVLTDNAAGQAFWARLGWRRRDDLAVYTLSLSAD